MPATVTARPAIGTRISAVRRYPRCARTVPCHHGAVAAPGEPRAAPLDGVLGGRGRIRTGRP
ncbi:hypothetical protein [Kitasatospora sp. NPDC088783]|uniref:hypothetical protein n=1 Tax=Kitasatospora sp. NPDC088783 TaxID=3364077 RepID=UPI0038196A5F